MKEQKYPAYLENAFTEGFAYTDEDNSIFKFHTTNMGMLKVQDGKIIACDPIVFYEEPPFKDDFPKGSFPVELAIASIDGNDERIGLARIKFSDNAPVKWDCTLCDGQDISTLEPDEYFGYGVDSGTGGFMDTSAATVLLQELSRDADFGEKLVDQLDKNYKDTRSWQMWEKDGANVAMFTSGWGDGLYASYIGYDDNGNICRLVTDFGLLDWDA
ncbi:MAG: DUF4241 domain-containing protein [Sphingobacteriales bacterium]|nr:MAG: DUF4241 domain-containing protein [Sphingobacteriales bacterium]